ncbi:exported protein [Candidatus Kuenenia stuttgartiensis]|uniref:Exported protein n=1 Tax=Kuenenia stuttgartiensis TaxID=174633 RepID=Q1Q2W2_KUEST|nr:MULTISPECIES: hypothetical protein [Kuenenia]MBZ0190573.1 hypothetical protein [Candidatus Kuenenia stuttgartiensis]MCL4728377.1 hypothetical protein [Candidatus Kuenenia stuttgartiensis]MCZ7620873.1 hypothetical protein [Candidatus Kuenenia sp.]QII11457.1 exported protein [Candidatus Kuenenia stuttgartiensis]CAJ74352.1 unknown protein [Candidatus Kuenenia stuttgartiensis]
MNGITCRNIFLYSIVLICVSFISAIAPTNNTIASDCKPKSMQTNPEKTLTIKKGKSGNVILRLKCKDDSPASGVAIETKVLKGNKNISFSPKSAVTDENGKAVFTITGDKKTETENAEIKFKADKLSTTLEIKVQAEECKLDTIKTNPENKVTLFVGQSSDITVRLKCNNGSPAVDVKVDAIIQKGSNSIKLSSSSALTDESGKAVFTVSGISKTKKDAPTIKFSADDIKTILEVKVKTEAEKDTEAGSEEETVAASLVKEEGEESSNEEIVDESISTDEVEVEGTSLTEEKTSADTAKTTSAEETTEITTPCKPKTVITLPDKKLTLEKGKNASITVKVKCKDDSPAEGVKLEAEVIKGKKYITLTPKSAETDKNGKAVFAVSGDMKTDTEPAEIKFKAEKLSAKLEVKVQAEACSLGSLTTNPDKKLKLKEGESSEVTVKAKCKNGSPAVDAKIDAIVQKDGNKVKISSTAILTDEAGKAVFTVTGARKTSKKDNISIKFSSGDLQSILDVNVD